MNTRPHTSPFETIRHEDEHVRDYWYARELYLLYPYDFKLQKAAQETRIVEPSDFAIFYDNMYARLRT